MTFVFAAATFICLKDKNVVTGNMPFTFADWGGVLEYAEEPDMQSYQLCRYLAERIKLTGEWVAPSGARSSS